MLPRRLSNNTGYASVGSLRHQVKLLKASSSRTPTGESVQNHEVVTTTWAGIEVLAAKYTEKQEHVVTEATHKIITRYIPGITTANLVQLWDGRIWNIEAVFDTDEAKFELQLYCYERG